MAASILVVEDDADAAKVVRAYLEREGYDVSVARDGVSGLEAALAEPPELVVLDWMLPGLDGLSFLRSLRRERAVPVIMLTARSEENDRIAGFEAGADDYVVKPFSPRELLARVGAVLRRAAAASTAARDALVVLGDVRIDLGRRQVEARGERVDLSALEFDLLATLAGAPGRVFRRGELIDRVWGPDFSGVDRVVDVHVSNLRQKLAAAGAEGVVGTVRGVGYRAEAA